MNEARRTGGLRWEKQSTSGGATSIKPGRFNTIGTAVSVYFLATGVTGLQLLCAQNYVQQLFYGAALVVAVVLSRQLRRSRA